MFWKSFELMKAERMWKDSIKRHRSICALAIRMGDVNHAKWRAEQCAKFAFMLNPKLRPGR